MKVPFTSKKISRKFLSELFTGTILKNKLSETVFLKVGHYYPGTIIIVSQFKIKAESNYMTFGNG